ncbi:MAG: hypothetical protein P1U74_00305 [Legionellaceae bacterium]|nr:hypothetical protein [Legionellaceae bacterium]
MKSLILHPTDISQWYALVNEAQASTQLALNEDTESYLVFLLQRFSQNPQLAESIIAIDFLESMAANNSKQIEQLKVVGDKSLLLCGLFPGIATRRSLSVDYYADMGQAAYLSVSELQKKSSANLFLELSEHFGRMKNILQAMRGDFQHFSSEDADSIKFDDDSHVH